MNAALASLPATAKLFSAAWCFDVRAAFLHHDTMGVYQLGSVRMMHGCSPDIINWYHYAALKGLS